MNSNPYAQYKQTAVQTASPEKLLLMLYDGAIKFLNQAKVAMDTRNIEESNKYIIKTQDIISELIVTLNMEYEISHNLHGIYDYLNRRLIQANIKKDPEILEEVLNHITELRQTWAEAAINVKSQPVLAGGVNIEG
ncbi:MAG: flagellar export chaperone FliS [Clostridia bacterium]|nr:flagellar export chaperone FliS [Clostridia bacterium]